MKVAGFGSIGLVVLTVLSAGLLIGCAAGTEEKRAEARGTADSFRSALSEMPARIDRTMADLMVLTDNRTTDKSKPLADFRKSLGAMDGDARRLGQEADRATSNAEAYFRQWQRDAVRDPAIRDTDLAGTRKANYDTARSYLDNARRHYLDFTENLHEIERMYAAGSVNATQPLVRAAIDKAGMDAEYVKNYVSRLSEQIDSTLRAQ